MAGSVGKRLLIFRVFLTVLFIASCFFLGYGFYYFNAIRVFIATAINQRISIGSRAKTAALPNQTNILLLGSDNDQKFTGNPLTQTMMVIHIDFSKSEVDMFSIPRDLWVLIQDSQTFGKIDQAAQYNGIPSAIAVVEQTFGIHIDHYAWVGLMGFIKSIDAIGGINLSVARPVLDNAYPTDINSPDPYGYQRLSIAAGRQHMGGEEALQYVRSRHEDRTGDFGRTARQRQLLLALKQIALTSSSLVSEAPQLFASLNGQIKTDMNLGDLQSLGLFFLTNKNNLVEKQITLSPPTYSREGFSIDGQNVVIAIASTSAQLVGGVFGSDAGQITLNNLTNIQGIEQ